MTCSGPSNKLRTYGIHFLEGTSTAPSKQARPCLGSYSFHEALFAALATLPGVSKARIQAPPEVVGKQMAENKASLRDPFYLI